MDNFHQQRGFLVEVFHPWVRREGPGSGFEISSSGAGGAGAGGVWKSRIWPPWDLGRKTRFSNGMAYNRSKVSVKKSQLGFVIIHFSRSIFPCMWNSFMDGWKWEFGSGQNWIFQTRFLPVFFFEKRDRTFFQNLKFPKCRVPAIQRMLKLS